MPVWRTPLPILARRGPRVKQVLRVRRDFKEQMENQESLGRRDQKVIQEKRAFKVLKVFKGPRGTRATKAIRATQVLKVRRGFRDPKVIKVIRVRKEFKGFRDKRGTRVIPATQALKVRREFKDPKATRVIKVHKGCKEFKGPKGTAAHQDHKDLRELPVLRVRPVRQDPRDNSAPYPSRRWNRLKEPQYSYCIQGQVRIPNMCSWCGQIPFRPCSS